MTCFLDINYKSINKYGEELCGDKVEIVKTNDEYIIVLSDGLGSGVKANILATMTTKIASTMLKNDASIIDTVETIVNTLPECKVRKLAYSTFTIIKIDKDNNAYIVEYDNPPALFYRHGRYLPVEKKEINIGSKKIFEWNITFEFGDSLSIISDGAVHAGVGQMLNLGWSWENINEYLENLNLKYPTAQEMNGNFIGVCDNLYDNKPGDDTTILTIKAMEPAITDVFAGPPSSKNLDKYFVSKMTEGSNKKVICGGTTGLIASRELKKELVVDIDTVTKEVPPIAYMEGFDLVTEGVLTLGKTLENMKEYNSNSYKNPIMSKSYDGCSLLTNMLMNNSTHINFYIGRAINPAHQNPDFPMGFNIKLKIINDLIVELEKSGKVVVVNYL